MLKVNTVPNELGMNDVIISKDEQRLMMLYANEQLVLAIKDSNKPIEITKENYVVYALFEQLFNRMINSEVFKVTKKKASSCQTIEDLEALKARVASQNERTKEKALAMNLFSSDTIALASEEIKGQANILYISKVEDKIVIRFETRNIKKEGCVSFYVNDSEYEPFQLLLMKLYYRLQRCEEEFHQIHIEEYMYEKQKVKSLEI